jgi:hypothetical protein
VRTVTDVTIPGEEKATDSIIENPLEFGIVSAVFLATVLLIIFTGK